MNEVLRGRHLVIFRGRWITAIVLFVLASLTFAMLWIYQIDPSICNGCGNCIPYCTTGALYMDGSNAVIDPDLCTGCGDCVPHCIRGAIYEYWYEGIPENDSESRISFGPNPTAGPVLVAGASDGELVRVFDLSGRLVASAAVSSDGEAALDLSNFASGKYNIDVGDHDFSVLTLVK